MKRNHLQHLKTSTPVGEGREVRQTVAALWPLSSRPQAKLTVLRSFCYPPNSFHGPPSANLLFLSSLLSVDTQMPILCFRKHFLFKIWWKTLSGLLWCFWMYLSAQILKGLRALTQWFQKSINILIWWKSPMYHYIQPAQIKQKDKQKLM